MNSQISLELQKILLKRRNKVLIDKDTDICKVFKSNILEKISTLEFDMVMDDYDIEIQDEISVSVRIGDSTLNFINGELDNNENENNALSNEKITTIKNIMKDETEKIKKQMSYALSLNKMIGKLGYSMDEKLFRVAATLDKKEIDTFSSNLIEWLKEMVGANVNYYPLYPNFPDQTISLIDIHIYLSSLLKYWKNDKYLNHLTEKINEITKDEKNEDEKNEDSTRIEYKNITLGKEEDLHQLMYNLMNSAEAISPSDINNLTIYYTNYDKFINYIPETIPNKENLVVITNIILTNCKEFPMEKLYNKYATVTDVLRLASVMSGGSPLISKKDKFKSFSNRERRLLMALLNTCNNRVEDFARYKDKWSRVFERIHPKSFKKQYPDLVDEMLGTYRYKKDKKVYDREIRNFNTINRIYNLHKNSEYIKTRDIYLFVDSINKLSKLDIPEEIKSNVMGVKENFISTIPPRYSYRSRFRGKRNSHKKEHDFYIKYRYNKNDFDKLKMNIINERNQELTAKSMELDIKIKEYKKNHQNFESKLNDFIHDKKYEEALELVVQRPGHFARHLDEYIEKFEDSEKVLDFFETIASKVSVKVLLSMKGYFQKRHEKLKARVFLIKGKTTKLYLKNKVKDELDLKLCEKICYICDHGLMAHFEEKPKLNNIYINEDLKKHLIPIDIRNANSALETYSKGTRFNLSYKEISKAEREEIISDLEDKLAKSIEELDINNEHIKQLETKANSTTIDISEKTMINKEIENDKLLNKSLNDRISKYLNEIEDNRQILNKKKGNMVRLFIWWTNTKNTIIDIDLSVAIYNENLEKLGHVSYTSLKNNTFKIFHSGDIVNGGDVDGVGAAEFIDFDPDYVCSKGARYILVSVISFRGVMFKDMEHCKFGWMERQSLTSDELFNPHTIKQKLDLNCENTSTIPVVFDCKTREIIWVDMTMIGNKSCTNIENSSKELSTILYYYLYPLKENMYNLINLHVKARNGKLVESEKELSEGDIAFVPCLPYKCIEGVQYIRPTDLDIILSEYIS